MLSYQNDASLKARFVGHIERHRVEDRVMQGLYGGLVDGEWKGCAVGCALHSLDEIDGKSREEYNDHEALSERLGIPLWLARLQDSIFEGLSAEEAKLWPTRLANAMPVGRDLEAVWPKLGLWLLADTEHGVLRLVKRDGARKAVANVAGLYERWIAGDKPASKEWQQARSDAYAAYAYAAYASAAYASTSAAYAAYASTSAAYAAYAYASADYAAYAYAAYASTSAAYAAGGVDAGKNHWKLISGKLCELLAAA